MGLFSKRDKAMFQNLHLVFFLVFYVPTILNAKIHKIETLNKSDANSMIFKPSFIKIELGDQIEFVPTDKGHNTQSVFIPEGARPWKSDPGTSVTLSFEQEGIYFYECLNHFVMGMSGIIQVGKPTNLEEAKKFLPNYKKKISIKKDRIDKSFKKIILKP
jgi:pseudoazurin